MLYFSDFPGSYNFLLAASLVENYPHDCVQTTSCGKLVLIISVRVHFLSQPEDSDAEEYKPYQTSNLSWQARGYKAFKEQSVTEVIIGMFRLMFYLELVYEYCAYNVMFYRFFFLDNWQMSLKNQYSIHCHADHSDVSASVWPQPFQSSRRRRSPRL